MPSLDDGYAGQTFGFSERLGIVFIAEAAGLSTIAVTSLLIYILYYALRRGRSKTWTGSTHIHYYFVNLLICDLIQALGGLLNIRWIIEAKVTENGLCSTQGILKQIGDVGVALTSLTIAIHTFFALVLQWHFKPMIALIVLAVIWVFLVLIVVIGLATHHGTDYYGNTQYWCWITEKYAGERIGLEYFWMWLAAGINLICYVFIALSIKGVIVFDKNRLRFRRPEDDANMHLIALPTTDEGRARANAVAMQMLFYPAVYIVTVFPIAIVRWITFSGQYVPFPATCFASMLFSSSGLFHVILFALTRPRLLPTRDPTYEEKPKLHTVSITLPMQSRVKSGWADDFDQWKSNGLSDADSEVPPVPSLPPALPPKDYEV